MSSRSSCLTFLKNVKQLLHYARWKDSFCYVCASRDFSLTRLEETSMTASQIKWWTERDSIFSQVKMLLLQSCGRGGAQNWADVSSGGCHVSPLGWTDGEGNLRLSYVWWPEMDHNLKSNVRSCVQCQTNRSMPPWAPLHPWEWLSHPWSRLHLDFACPFMGQILMIMVDAHSKWIEAHVINNIPAPTTIDKLRQVFAVHGFPDSLTMARCSQGSCSMSSCNKMAFVISRQPLSTQPQMAWWSETCRPRRKIWRGWARYFHVSFSNTTTNPDDHTYPSWDTDGTQA